MPANASSNYSPRPWMQAPPVELPAMPDTYEQYAVGNALDAAMGETNEAIRATRPPLEIDAFPPRYGYDRTPLRIQDIATIEDRYERRDYSGKVSGYAGSSTPSQPLV